MADSGSDGLRAGRLTFNAEGNNIRNSPWFTRKIHFPERGVSGVTIGRGYDMGSRSQREVYSDLVRAGVEADRAQLISQAARLRGTQAAEFVRQNRDAIGEITESQQVNLFNQIYSDYERRARSVYYAKTANVENRTEWENLRPAIRDVLVDIVYQGYRATSTMPVAASNDIDSLIQLIRNNRELSQDEPGRNRAGYLDANR